MINFRHSTISLISIKHQSHFVTILKINFYLFHATKLLPIILIYENRFFVHFRFLSQVENLLIDKIILIDDFKMQTEGKYSLYTKRKKFRHLLIHFIVKYLLNLIMPYYHLLISPVRVTLIAFSINLLFHKYSYWSNYINLCNRKGWNNIENLIERIMYPLKNLKLNFTKTVLLH